MFAQSGPAELAYEITGFSDGADVLLIHAGVTDRRSWQHVVKRLAPRHRCIAYDMRGYGETQYEHEDRWSPVADAVAVLDAAGVGEAVVVASSMGGQTAIDLALGHPDTVAGLALIGPAIRGAPYQSSWMAQRPSSIPRSRRPRRPVTLLRSIGWKPECGSMVRPPTKAV